MTCSRIEFRIVSKGDGLEEISFRDLSSRSSILGILSRRFHWRIDPRLPSRRLQLRASFHEVLGCAAWAVSRT